MGNVFQIIHQGEIGKCQSMLIRIIASFDVKA